MIVWLIQIINYTLALFMWLIVGRLVLSLLRANRENFIMAFFIKFTEPVYKITRRIVPFSKESCIPGISIILIIIVRLALVIIFKQGAYK
jgi:YggT family protein